nr:MAG TPA: hypothetical protein [Caudoviricetes sp.]
MILNQPRVLYYFATFYRLIDFRLCQRGKRKRKTREKAVILRFNAF